MKIEKFMQGDFLAISLAIEQTFAAGRGGGGLLGNHMCCFLKLNIVRDERHANT